MAYYVFDDAKNLFEGMTKEQIINAIANATGQTPAQIDVNAVTTAIKEQNAQRSVALWVGTQAEYNAIQQPDNDTLYVVTDPHETSELQNQVDLLQARVEELENARNGVLLWSGTAQEQDEITPSTPVTAYKEILVCLDGEYIVCGYQVGAAPNLTAVYAGSRYNRYAAYMSCVTLHVHNDGDITVMYAETISQPFTTNESETAGRITSIRGLL